MHDCLPNPCLKYHPNATLMQSHSVTDRSLHVASVAKLVYHVRATTDLAHLSIALCRMAYKERPRQLKPN